MSDKHDYVKEEANTPRKMTREAFAFADRLFAHLDHLQLDAADQIDFGASAMTMAYPHAPFELVRVTLRWFKRPWLDDATQPHNVVSTWRYLHGLPTSNEALEGVTDQGLLRDPSMAVRVFEDGTHGWYASMATYDGHLYIVLPRCVWQSAKYLRQISSLLRQPAWFGNRTDTDGYCVYTGQWFGMLEEGVSNKAPELFNPEWHYWYTNDRPYMDSGYTTIPQSSLSYGSLYCCRGESSGRQYGHFGADDALWKLREHARLARGAYNKLPDRVLDALDTDKLEFAYPHLALQDGHTGMIAYTRDEASGIRDRQLVMKPGRFIKQFARNGGISDDEVKYLAAEACGTVEIKFHQTRERQEYSRVYQRGPQSCMAYGPLAADRFDGDHLMVNGEFVHPCEIYAHPENDIALVYGELGANGKETIVSRALVNTAKKYYCAIYVKDSPATAREQMELHLKAQGFQRNDDVLVGQKLLLIETDDRSIISPYLDPGNIGVRIDRENNCLVAGEGGAGANHSTGTLNDYTCGSQNDWDCECCGDTYDEDDNYQLNHCYERICMSCANEHYVEAFVTQTGCEYYVNDSDTVHSCAHVSTGALAGYSYVYFNSSRRDIRHYGCVELDTSRYDDNGHPMIANLDDCVSDDDDNWLLRSDVEQYAMFIDSEGDAHLIEEWVAVTEEDGTVTLAELDGLDDDLYDVSPFSHEDWPMLPFFTLKAVPDEEDDEAVNTLTANEDECPDQSVA